LKEEVVVVCGGHGVKNHHYCKTFYYGAEPIEGNKMNEQALYLINIADGLARAKRP
jgi:hypothetical protein